MGSVPADRLFVSPSEVQAITAAPPVRTMAELPPKFFAPPDVAIAPRPPLPIPAGTVIELTIQGSWDGAGVERLEAYGTVVPAMLDQALVVGGKEVLGAHSAAMLKGRIIGSGRRFDPIQNRPDTVQIAFTTDEINIDRADCRPCGKWADLKSNEVVFTVPYQSNANKPGVMFDTRIRFTIGGSGTSKRHPRRRRREGDAELHRRLLLRRRKRQRLQRRRHQILSNEPRKRASARNASRRACSRRSRQPDRWPCVEHGHRGVRANKVEAGLQTRLASDMTETDDTCVPALPY